MFGASSRSIRHAVLTRAAWNVIVPRGVQSGTHGVTVGCTSSRQSKWHYFLSSISATPTKDLSRAWIPPDNILLRDDVVSPEPPVDMDGQNAIYKKWLQEASSVMDARSNLIKVKREADLSPKEIIVALALNGAKDIRHFAYQDGFHTIIATASSPRQLKKLAHIIYKSMRLRKLRFSNHNRPVTVTDSTSYIDSRTVELQIFTAKKREEDQIDYYADPANATAIRKELEKAALAESRAVAPEMWEYESKGYHGHLKYINPVELA